MKLVNKNLGLEIEFKENQILNLTIELPQKFSDVVHNISSQIDGGEGEFLLSEVEKELLLEKKAVLINNPLVVNCNEKKIINQIHRTISDNIVSKFYGEFAILNQQILNFIDMIINTEEYNLTTDVDFQEVGLLKYCNVHIDSCYDSYAEKFIDYLRAVRKICNIEIVFVLNLKQYFNNKELDEIYKHCFYTKIYLVNIEGNKSAPIKGDRYIILDKDLCLLEFLY